MQFDVLKRFRTLGKTVRQGSGPHHKFFVGQAVGLLPGHAFRGVVSGRYRVLELLPFADGSALYRIGSPEELFERIAREYEIFGLPHRA